MEAAPISALPGFLTLFVHVQMNQMDDPAPPVSSERFSGVIASICEPQPALPPWPLASPVEKQGIWEVSKPTKVPTM